MALLSRSELAAIERSVRQDMVSDANAPTTSPIRDALDSQSMIVKELQEAIEAMFIRLNPVIRPEPAREALKDAWPQSSEYLDRIRKINGDIALLMLRIRAVMDVLDV